MPPTDNDVPGFDFFPSQSHGTGRPALSRAEPPPLQKDILCLQGEQWVPVPLENCTGYWVSDLGRIKSDLGRFYREPHILTTAAGGRVTLSIGGVFYSVFVARLVMRAFVGLPAEPDHTGIRFLNGCRLDCRLANLEYGPQTRSHQPGWVFPAWTEPVRISRHQKTYEAAETVPPPQQSIDQYVDQFRVSGSGFNPTEPPAQTIPPEMLEQIRNDYQTYEVWASQQQWTANPEPPPLFGDILCLPGEQWVPVPLEGFGAYLVSDMGRIRSEYGVRYPQILRPHSGKVSLYRTNGEFVRLHVCRLVLRAFTEPPPDQHRYGIRFVNKNRRDCRLKNLEYGIPDYHTQPGWLFPAWTEPVIRTRRGHR